MKVYHITMSFFTTTQRFKRKQKKVTTRVEYKKKNDPKMNTKRNVNKMKNRPKIIYHIYIISGRNYLHVECVPAFSKECENNSTQKKHPFLPPKSYVEL